jgi:RHS repeat-associated protein
MRRTFMTLAALLLLPISGAAQVVEYYHLDALGSVRVVTNQAGAIVESHDYKPYGEEWNPPPPRPGEQPIRFTGKERDTDTTLDYFGARYYANRTARFSSTDPVYTWQENLADPQRWNRYAYVRGNPLRYVDPDGRALMRIDAEGRVKAQIALGAKVRGTVGHYLQADNPNQSPSMWLASTVVDSVLAVFFVKSEKEYRLNLILNGLPTPIGMVEQPGVAVLSRFGTRYETAARLAGKAAEAEARIGIHGVSATERILQGEVSTAARTAVEGQFVVHDTPSVADPLHKTIELGKPVTREIADIFNALFGRSR